MYPVSPRAAEHPQTTQVDPQQDESQQSIVAYPIHSPTFAEAVPDLTFGTG